MSLSSAILNWETIGSGILDILWMVVKGLIVLGIGVLIIKWLMRLSTACLKRSRLSVTLHAFILSSVKVISYVFLIIIVLEEIIIKIILEIVLEILKIIRRKETVDAVYRCSYSRYNTDNCKNPYYL